MEVIKELCVKFAEENASWGYERIQGALANLGYEVSESTVGNILRAAGVPPSTERMKKSTWKPFVRSHMATMCVADFFDNRGVDNERSGSLPHIFRYESCQASGRDRADQLPNERRGSVTTQANHSPA